MTDSKNRQIYPVMAYTITFGCSLTVTDQIAIQALVKEKILKLRFSYF